MPSTEELLKEVRDQTGQGPERERSESTPSERQSTAAGPSLGSRFRERVFSPRGFVLSLVVLTVGFLLVSALLPLGPLDQLGGLLGMLAAGFGLGLLGKSRYREVALAGGVAAGVTTLFNFLVLSAVAGVGVPLVAVGAGAGVLAAVAGLYFGRDLRAGLTEDL